MKVDRLLNSNVICKFSDVNAYYCKNNNNNELIIKTGRALTSETSLALNFNFFVRFFLSRK